MRSADTLLTSANESDDPPADGMALIMGGSGDPTPTQGYADTAAALYLEPNGFSGATQILTTPELLVQHRAVTETEGADILTQNIRQDIAYGKVGPDNPAYVFGYSQSSAVSGLSMNQLDAAGVPSDDVHFVLVGDPGVPNGGLYTAFGLTGGAYPDDVTPGDLYPTDVYSLEYDGVTDFPHYAGNLTADLNAFMGTFIEHYEYLGLTPDQIASAVQLPTSAADTSTDYYMIPQPDTLPILVPLLLSGPYGKALYDLLEPATRIQVDLGYGSLTDGWNQGDADVITPVVWSSQPSDISQSSIDAAMFQAWQQGLHNFTNDLMHPSMTSLLGTEPSSTLVAAAFNNVFGDGSPLLGLLRLLGLPTS